MKIDGGCHCGAIAYEAEVNPDYVVICHCPDCQTFSGAPYRVSVPVLVKKFTLRGVPTTYVKTARNGNRIVQNFCGTCGSAMFSNKENDTTMLNLRLGGVRQRADLAPKYQGFCESALAWATDIGGVTKLPERK